MDISTLQKAIDENRLNVTKLSTQEKNVIDQALKEGILTGPESVQAIEDKLLVGRDYLAAEAEAGFDPKQGEGRDYAVLGGEATAYLGYMGKNNKAIKADIEKYGTRFGTKAPQALKEKLGIETKSTSQSLGKIFKGMSKAPRGIGKVFSLTTGFLDKVSLGLLPALSRIPAQAKVARKYGLTEATKAELKGLAFVAPVGGVAGGGLYDLDNFNKSLAITSQLDLKDLSKRDFDALTPTERILTRGVDDYTQSLVWGLGTQGILSYGLIPMGKFAAKFMTGTGGEVSKRRLKYAINAGQEDTLSLAALANTDFTMGKLANSYGRTIGVLPGASRGYAPKFAESQKKISANFLEHVKSFGPVQHANLFGYQLRNVMAENFKENYRMIDRLYENVKLKLDNFETLKNKKLIPTTSAQAAGRKALEEFSNLPAFVKSVDETFELGKTEIGRLAGKGTFLNELAAGLATLSGRGADEFISGAEYFDLHRIINKGISEGGDKISRKQLTSLFDIKFALEKDLRFFDAGEEAFQIAMDKAGIAANQRAITKADLKSFYNSERMGDGFFFASVMPFNDASVARALKAQDGDLFTNLTLFDISGSEKVTPAGMFNHLSKVVLRSKDAQTISDFAGLIGGKNPKRNIKDLTSGPGQRYNLRQIGQTTMERMTSRHLFDAYAQAFTNAPSARALSIQEITAKAQKAGVTDYKRLDEYPEFVRGMDLNPAAKEFSVARSFKPDSILKMKDDLNFNVLDFSPEKAGDFNVTKFKNYLGLGDEGGEAALKEMFVQSGRTVKEADTQLKALKKMTEVFEQLESAAPGNTSQFLTRRLGLQGLSGIMDPTKLLIGGAAIGGIGLPATVISILGLSKLGKMLADPKAARALLDIASPEQRVKDIESTYIMDYVTPRKRVSTAYLLEKLFGDPPGLEKKEADKPSRVDVNKITFEEITKLLNEGPTFVPKADFDYDDLSPRLQRKMFPDIYRRRLLPAAVQDAYKTLEGSRQRKEKEYNSPTPPSATPAPEQQEPRSTVPDTTPAPMPVTPPPQNTGGQLTYESIFPNDPIGSLLAQKQRGPNENRS